MKVVWLENDFLRIGVLAGRGSDIFEFRFKPLDCDFLLRLPKGIRNPNQDFSQMRNTPNQFEDYYYGGWQEILPNSPTFNYRGASLGQHGEISLIPWKYSIVENDSKKISVKLWTRPLRFPIKIEKTLKIVHDKPTLFIEENIINESKKKKQKSICFVTGVPGSGKTLMAEHAILESIRLGKKAIYTSPIKSLSNQKFSEFTKKFGDKMSIGILTGDIKFNSDADCVIMTTEILRNLF